MSKTNRLFFILMIFVILCSIVLVTTGCSGSGGGSNNADTGNAALDTIAPTVPTGLTAVAASSSSIALNWAAATDNVGVTGYRIYRDGQNVATSVTNTYTDTALSSGTTYTYTVCAYDAAGNNSAQSVATSATTLSTAPSVALSSIILSPSNPSVPAGGNQQFMATGIYSDSSNQDLTTSVLWVSTNTSVATISTVGLATAVSAGSTTITATSSAATGSKVGTSVLLVTAVTTTVQISKTGQTTAHVSGDDGNLKKGIAWPNPRFTNADGTTPITGNVIVDQLTGLMWTKNANTPTVATCLPNGGGPRHYVSLGDNVYTYVACLNSNNFLGYNDWRLPNVNELESLINYERSSDNDVWLSSNGFTGISSQPVNYEQFMYWTSTKYSSNAMIINISNGYIMENTLGQQDSYYWPVRSGDGTYASTIKLSRTGQTTYTYAGEDGNLKKGVAWPNPRFTNPDGSTPIASSLVVDQHTSLMWTADAFAPGPAACNPAVTKTWNAALTYVACLNSNSYLGYTDWRLPNVKELRSLLNYSQTTQADYLNGQGFSNVKPYQYWSSTVNYDFGGGAYTIYDINMGYGPGTVSSESNSQLRYTWPVRGGQ